MRRATAFSLIELLAAVLITAVLAMFGFGAYRSGLAAGDRARSASNLKVLILATQILPNLLNCIFDGSRHSLLQIFFQLLLCLTL